MVRLGTVAKNPRPLHFGTVSHAKAKPNYIRDTALAGKSLWHQMNGTQINKLVDCKPRSGAGNQLITRSGAN